MKLLPLYTNCILKNDILLGGEAIISVTVYFPSTSQMNINAGVTINTCLILKLLLLMIIKCKKLNHAVCVLLTKFLCELQLKALSITWLKQTV